MTASDQPWSLVEDLQASLVKATGSAEVRTALLAYVTGLVEAQKAATAAHNDRRDPPPKT